MKVVIEKVFPLASTAEAAWRCLQDIEAVAGCMPGAKITERLDDTHFKGTVTVRVGPATMSFKGNIEVLELDAARRTLHLVGKGSDTTGTSAASMDLVATVETTGPTCDLQGKSEVAMSGKAAAFGGRMMNTVADQILKQFVANFATRVQSVNVSQATPASDNPATKPEPQTPAAPAELNGMALAWAIIRDWLRGLFSRKTA
jgi:uncharacterized protein